MMKPSKIKAATSRKKTAKRKPAARKPAPRPVDVVTTSPAPDVEEPQADVAKFDHDGDGHPGGSLPHQADAQSVTAAADAPAETVSIGSVECRIKRLPTKVVLGLLGPDGSRRIEAEQSTASFESTRKRLLATDGRATPVVFEDGDPPTILHGFEELAAAQVCGVPEVFVILVPAGGASEAQSHIVEMVRRQRDQEKPSDDDELFYRVHAED